MDGLKLLGEITSNDGNIRVYASSNPISKNEFYKKIAKIEYDYQMSLKQRKEA